MCRLIKKDRKCFFCLKIIDYFYNIKHLKHFQSFEKTIKKVFLKLSLFKKINYNNPDIRIISNIIWLHDYLSQIS